MVDFDEHRPSAEQYRERAKRVRYTAQAVRTALLRDDLLDIADEFDQLADIVGRGSAASTGPERPR